MEYELYLFIPMDVNLSQGGRRNIRKYFHGISILCSIHFVTIVYHIIVKNGEEIVNFLQKFMQDIHCSPAAAPGGPE